MMKHKLQLYIKFLCSGCHRIVTNFAFNYVEQMIEIVHESAQKYTDSIEHVEAAYVDSADVSKSEHFKSKR